EICYANTCIPRGNRCERSSDCPGDTYCASDAPGGPLCVPFGVPRERTHDPNCTRLVIAGVFSPSIQCEFQNPPPGDPFPQNIHVLTTPVVVDFRIGRGPDAPSRPSIVAVFDDGVDGRSEEPTGVIRILDGATCTQQAELGSLQIVSHSSSPAVGDLDGDGRPEIVAYKANGGLVAFRYQPDLGQWVVWWRSHHADGTPFNPTGGGWAGPTIVDLDNDGRPEVLRESMVFSSEGVYLGGRGQAPTYLSGQLAVALDVDRDGKVELINGDILREWNAERREWVPDPISTTPRSPGFVAVADFGAFPGSAMFAPEVPEIVVVTSGTVRVQTLDGTIVFGPVPIPGGGRGGPPTVGDFDGDGRPEIATAAAVSYTVFDLDCVPATRVGECRSGRSDGILWTQPAQDQSSNVTGSSIFDFEGDGKAEAVYGDECFLRVYDGATGQVLFSQARSSCTWYENPVIADVDGDFNAEIVIGDNFNCGSADFGRDCSGFVETANRNVDPTFPGLRCESDSDCLSGRCDHGLCRCTMDSECCAGLGCERAPFVCAPPPAGTPGSGNTCRAARPRGTRGIRVYRDALDRWVNTRTIWNQHVYYVTNVSTEGRIPRTSEAEANWLNPSFNNFRQNTQGDPIPGAAPDLSASGTPLVCNESTARLQARVCNRGSSAVGSGVTVSFYAGDPRAGGRLLCTGRTARNLHVGECEVVQCEWHEAPRGPSQAVDVYVVVDTDGEVSECREENNIALFEDVYCVILG
ncbi:MAG: VCBS repeat-containing protein, partial [Sandaracinaceae bacterium]|nr:VCBS repeat-containing protein [Sandaracinaceae bacterium]